ncbi:DUF6894 family protein [Sphingomonas sp.]|jgi:hypothetical protein|uniref:DUF6894 family protein n=1 Tax=Sphingomonas sp. TaxID=28214 RepID=UPI002FC75CCE
MRYFFHLREPGGYVVDHEGLELGCIDAVRTAATCGARSIIADEILRGSLPLATILEVEDEHGRRVLELPFSETVRVDG